ncbi:MAG: CPBP family intramembrane metalloprotease [Anaerolineales bacterium]|jgi:membrane protease YdiL (CAAX protease family)
MTLTDWISCIVPLIFAGLIVWRWRQTKGSFWEAFGVTIDRRVPLECLVGFTIGGLAMFGIFGVEWALKFIRIDGLAAPGEDFWPWIVFLIIAALLEEVLSRSFILGGLVLFLKENKWLAVAISAAFFGLAHAANPNATIISVFGNALGGVMYAVAFLESGRVWLGWGLHFAWNFFQGPLLGFPVSGLTEGGSILQQVAVGPEIITGGAYGPEAGLVGMSFRFVVIALLYAWFSWEKKRPLVVNPQ